MDKEIKQLQELLNNMTAVHKIILVKFNLPILYENQEFQIKNPKIFGIEYDPDITYTDMITFLRNV